MNDEQEGTKENQPEKIDLLDLLELAVIQKLQDGFAEATGVASVITNPEGVPLTKPSNFCRLCKDVIRKTKKGLQNCFRSDAIIGRPNPNGPVIQPCLSGGLWDGGASIYAGEHHIANWLIGQVRNEETSEARVLEYAREIGVDEDKYRKAFLEVPIMSTDRFRSICEFLFLMANQLSSLAYEKLLQKLYIEERRKSEDERRQLEKQLHQSRQLQMVGQLAGGIAHDFNNILTAILGNVELLSIDVQNSKIDQGDLLNILSYIYDAGIRASNLTHQLLAFARQQVSSPKIIIINDVIERFETILKRLIPENINLELILDKKIAPVLADRSQLEQVILNLVVNAADAMPEGGHLTIETSLVFLEKEYVERKPEAKPGAHVVLVFTDTGIGMPPSVIERIFEPFFTTKPVGRGSGLGLATVYGIIKQAGGIINVYSEPDKGSVFRIYWPVAEGIPVTFEQEDLDVGELGSETVLLCEDFEPVRSLAVRILEMAGYKVYKASNGEEALKLLESGNIPIDILVTDVVMPGMNGRMLADAVRERIPSVKVLYTSGYTANVIAHHGVLEQGITLLEKPYSQKALLKAVRRLLDQRL